MDNPAVIGTWIGMFVPMAALLFAFGIAMLVVKARLAREQQRVDLHNRIIEKAGSARELGEFLGTDAGAKFLASLSQGGPAPHARVLWSVRGGTVALTLGVGLFVGILAGAFGNGAAPMRIPATILTALGVGMLLSALLSYKLSRRFAREERETENPSPSGMTA